MSEKSWLQPTIARKWWAWYPVWLRDSKRIAWLEYVLANQPDNPIADFAMYERPWFYYEWKDEYELKDLV